MKLGPIFLLAWLVLVASSLIPAIVAPRRHGLRKGGVAILSPFGALASFGLVAIWVGLAERAYSLGIAAWEVVTIFAVGMLGLYVQVVAWRVALRKPIPPGHCKKCGYDLKELAKCPECGTPAR